LNRVAQELALEAKEDVLLLTHKPVLMNQSGVFKHPEENPLKRKCSQNLAGTDSETEVYPQETFIEAAGRRATELIAEMETVQREPTTVLTNAFTAAMVTELNKMEVS